MSVGAEVDYDTELKKLEIAKHRRLAQAEDEMIRHYMAHDEHLKRMEELYRKRKGAGAFAGKLDEAYELQKGYAWYDAERFLHAKTVVYALAAGVRGARWGHLVENLAGEEIQE